MLQRRECFFVTTGNHDPALPLGLVKKNTHFLAADGSRVTREDSCAGYVSQMECYADFGFFPRKDDCYWESPFTSYTYDKYAYEDACRESVLGKRTHIVRFADGYGCQLLGRTGRRTLAAGY